MISETHEGQFVSPQPRYCANGCRTKLRGTNPDNVCSACITREDELRLKRICSYYNPVPKPFKLVDGVEIPL